MYNYCLWLHISVLENMLVGRFGKGVDTSAVMVYFAAPDWMTCSHLLVNGGLLDWRTYRFQELTDRKE